MKECCATCKKWMELVMFDYSHGGCEHHDMGHACLALAHDGRVIYKVGTDAENGMCECYEPKGVRA